jgi:hypothetical protein
MITLGLGTQYVMVGEHGEEACLLQGDQEARIQAGTG